MKKILLFVSIIQQSLKVGFMLHPCSGLGHKDDQDLAPAWRNFLSQQEERFHTKKLCHGRREDFTKKETFELNVKKLVGYLLFGETETCGQKRKRAGYAGL